MKRKVIRLQNSGRFERTGSVSRPTSNYTVYESVGSKGSEDTRVGMAKRHLSKDGYDFSNGYDSKEDEWIGLYDGEDFNLIGSRKFIDTNSRDSWDGMIRLLVPER